MAVAEQLIRQGRQVRVVLGEVELERWGDTETLRWPALAKVLRLGSYLELLAELGGAGVFVGNDSGPAHLAAMIGVPTLCLFGPTSERLWRPMGPKVRTLRAWPMEKLGVHEVVEELQELRGN
jgi:ADP-heptose:LPS heptosyltransferase